jgi:hypothetical protein
VQYQHERDPPSRGLPHDVTPGHATASPAPHQALQRPAHWHYPPDLNWFGASAVPISNLAGGSDAAANAPARGVPDLNLCSPDVLARREEAAQRTAFHAEAPSDALQNSLLEALALVAEQWDDPQSMGTKPG